MPELIADSSRLIYLIHPRLRALILRLLAHLYTFVDFIKALDQAIPSPSSTFQSAVSSVDPKSTLLAKEIASDILDREGIDLVLWGKALETAQRQSSSKATHVEHIGSSETDIAEKPADVQIDVKPNVEQDHLITSLLDLSLEPITHLVKPFLTTIPTPSSLFAAPYAPSEVEYDAITHESFSTVSRSKARIKCVRCG